MVTSDEIRCTSLFPLNDKMIINGKERCYSLLNLLIGGSLLVLGSYCMFKFMGSSVSVKSRDDNNVANPTDESIVPPNSTNGL